MSINLQLKDGDKVFKNMLVNIGARLNKPITLKELEAKSYIHFEEPVSIGNLPEMCWEGMSLASCLFDVDINRDLAIVVVSSYLKQFKQDSWKYIALVVARRRYGNTKCFTEDMLAAYYDQLSDDCIFGTIEYIARELLETIEEGI